MRSPLAPHAALLIGLVASTAAAQQVIVDNVDPGFSVLQGTWSTGAFPTPWGSDYRFALTGSTTEEVEWRPNLPAAGNYRVEVWYVEGTNRASDAPFTIHHSGGSTTVDVNQQNNGSNWLSIGVYPFAAGTGGSVTLSDAAGPTVVIADAVRFTFESGTGGAADEFRGMWVSRFEWPSSSLTAVQNNIIAIMNNLQTHNFNAVLLQVRGQGDTLYPSPEEPWSPLMSSNGLTPAGWGSFDPLAYAVTAAHDRNLEFHAYINTHVIWQGSQCSPLDPPTYNLDHPYWDHFDETNPAARDWLIHDEFGNPVGCDESNYTWIAPGVPGAQAYVRRQIMHVVDNYDVDGVHWDRIRSPGTEFSYDPISEARRAGPGNPDGLGFANWTRDQITRFNRDIYAQIMEVKPWVKVSSAPLGLYRANRYPGYPSGPCGYFYGYSCVYQDAQAWIQAGAQDFLVPQIYWADNGSNPEFSEILPDWVANDGGRHIYAGQLRSVGVAELISQINATTSIGGEGNVVFSYGSFNSNNYWPNYSGPGGPYEEDANVPAMPWKDNPTQAIILGNVTDPNGPVVDCHVTRTGSSYTALSSGDGLYSFLQVDPGTYTLTFDKPGTGFREICDVTVAAGDVLRLDILLTSVFTPGDFDGDGVVDQGDFASITACLAGPDVSVSPVDCCAGGDADIDDDFDLQDLIVIQALLE